MCFFSDTEPALIPKELGIFCGRDKLKAAFILQFIRYTEWPAVTAGKIAISVIGDESLAKELQTAISAKASVSGPTITLKSSTSEDEATGANVLYLNLSSDEKFQLAASKLGSKGVLIISHGANLGKKGSLINFYLENERLRFEVNLKAANLAGLNLSSQLLKLARIIE